MHKAYRHLVFATVTAACSVMAGCAIPHNNTLVFAVHRKIGIDVTPTNATGAGLTIGYSSSEFAWVPLWANGPNNKPFVDCSSITHQSTTTQSSEPVFCAKSPKFTGRDAEGRGNGRDEDAYSVFASFGGNASGQATSDTKAELRVASFFATGIAAQNLADGDPQKLLGADTRGGKGSHSGALRTSLNDYFTEVTADKTTVTKECVKALQLGDKFAKIDDYVAGLDAEKASGIVAREVSAQDYSHVAQIKQRADALRAHFNIEKANANAAKSKTAVDDARKKTCAST